MDNEAIVSAYSSLNVAPSLNGELVAELKSAGIFSVIVPNPNFANEALFPVGISTPLTTNAISDAAANLGPRLLYGKIYRKDGEIKLDVIIFLAKDRRMTFFFGDLAQPHNDKNALKTVIRSLNGIFYQVKYQHDAAVATKPQAPP